jgi:isopentenyldiphosphate isomerase
METAVELSVREKLHLFIDEIEDQRANSLYGFLKEEIEDNAIYTDEFVAELDQISEEVKNGAYIKEEEFWEKMKEHINAKK